jgi:DinB superfamily
MSTITTKTQVPDGLDPRVLSRVLEEGYGPGAWHGADLRAALADVNEQLAYWRPAPDRHCIAEIALHHAYCTRQVCSRLSGTPPEPFLLEGDDWFALPDTSTVSWRQILAAVEAEQRRLADLVSAIGVGKVSPAVPEAEQFDLVLGITCHGIYHAGQVQLIKRLAG